MPVSLQLLNFDDLYHKLESDKILINQIDPYNAETKEMIDAFAMKNYADDNLSLIPSCQCGHTKGAYYVGKVCHVCNTKIVNGLDDAISFLLWVEKPQGVEYFISPIVMRFLLSRYTINRPKISLIEHILVPTYRAETRHKKVNQDVLDKLDYLLAQHKIAKGYNSFVQNFFRVLEILETEFYTKGKGEPYDFISFLQDNKTAIFSNYLPFPNKIVFASESNELGKFFDKSLLSPINVIRRLSGIDGRVRPSSTKQVKVAKSLIELGLFYDSYMTKPIFKKVGLVRQHMCSTRTHFTARAVIVSLMGQHDHDEIHIPWSVGVSLFRPFVIKALEKRGFSYRKAIKYMMFYNRLYCPILDEIFHEFIANTENGIIAAFNRNPSLHRGSIQRVRITRIKTDPADTTFSMSDRIGPGFNSDHDGRLHCRLKTF